MMPGRTGVAVLARAAVGATHSSPFAAPLPSNFPSDATPRPPDLSADSAALPSDLSRSATRDAPLLPSALRYALSTALALCSLHVVPRALFRAVLVDRGP